MPITASGKATEFIAFSRSSLATVTDVDGRLKWAPHNLLTYSEQFDNPNWARTNILSVTANAVNGPNGTKTADLVIPSTTNSGHYLSNLSAAATSLTFGAFVKTAGYSKVAFRENVVTGAGAAFDLSGSGSVIGVYDAGVATASNATITAVGDDWYLISCRITFTSSASYGFSIGVLSPSYASGGLFASWEPNGTDGIYVWGTHMYRSELQMQANTSIFPFYNPTTARNLLGFSEAFGSWTYNSSNVEIVSNSVIAPNGLQTADKLVAKATSAIHVVQQTLSTLISGTTYCVSVYAKAAEYSKVGIRENNSTGAYATYSLSGAGSVIAQGDGGTGAITALSDGWYRISMISATGSTNFNFTIYALNNAYLSGNPISHTYTGDGSSGIYLWGAQLSDSGSLDAYTASGFNAPVASSWHGPRREFNASGSCLGLLVEEPRTNLALHSNDLTAAAWTASSVTTARTATGPDGMTNSATTLTASAGDGTVLQSITSASATRTTSVYIKRRTGSGVIQLTQDNGSTWTTVTVTGDWSRVEVPSATVTDPTIGIRIRTNGDAVDVFGFQNEVGGFPTSLIVTAGSTVTRSADVASLVVSRFPHSSAEGTLVASGDFVGFDAAKQPTFVALTDGTPATSPSVSWVNLSQDTSNVVSARRSASTTATEIAATNAQSSNVARKLGVAFKQGDTDALSVNGGTVATQSGVSSAYANTVLRIGGFDTNGTPSTTDPGYLNGHIRQIVYLPRKLTNADLVARTA